MVAQWLGHIAFSFTIDGVSGMNYGKRLVELRTVLDSEGNVIDGGHGVLQTYKSSDLLTQQAMDVSELK